MKDIAYTLAGALAAFVFIMVIFLLAMLLIKYPTYLFAFAAVLASFAAGQVIKEIVEK